MVKYNLFYANSILYNHLIYVHLILITAFHVIG